MRERVCVCECVCVCWTAHNSGNSGVGLSSLSVYAKHACMQMHTHAYAFTHK